MDTSAVKVGPGMTREVGDDAARLGCRRVMVVTDSRLAALRPVSVTMQSLADAGVEAVCYDGVRCEPTDASWLDATAFARDGHFDGYVAVGGGSAIDTAKAANLYATYPADLLTYAANPVGRGVPIPGPLKPLIAIPTTAGTGSETTGVAIVDYLPIGVKIGIASRAIRPSLGIIDPDNTRTLPPMVAASSGLDVLCHGLESYTALPYTARLAPAAPSARTTYQGANPISDVWAARAVEMAARHLTAAVRAPGNDEARTAMLLASTFAGIGFGNAGVHICHAMSYPISAVVKTLKVEGYPPDHGLVPHGMSVALTAPAVFRWTAASHPIRHLAMAAAMGADISGVPEADAGACLAAALIELLRTTNMPNGLSAIGYTPAHVPALVAGTVPQQRILALAPRPATADVLARLFLDSMRLW